MKRFASCLALVAVARLAATASPLPAQTNQTSTKSQKLADGVWAMQPEKGANVGWFLLGDGVVAVDSGGDLATGKDILQQIAETTGGKPVRMLIITHAHGDHTGGIRAFAAAGARIVCQENIAGQILGLVTQQINDPGDPLSAKAGFHPAVEAISERVIFVDGIHNVQVYFLGAAHTKGDLIVYLVGDRVLYSGDIALNGLVPYMQSADVDPVGWERALAAIAKVGPEKLVPGHGEIGPVAGINDSLAYVRYAAALSKKFGDLGLSDERIPVEMRAPENAVKNIPVNDANIANVQALTKTMRTRAAAGKPTAAAPTPTPHR